MYKYYSIILSLISISACTEESTLPVIEGSIIGFYLKHEASKPLSEEKSYIFGDGLSYSFDRYCPKITSKHLDRTTGFDISKYKKKEITDCMAWFKTADKESEMGRGSHNLYDFIVKYDLSDKQLHTLGSEIYNKYTGRPESGTIDKTASSKVVVAEAKHVKTSSSSNGLQFEYRCSNGKSISVFKDGNYLTAYGGNSVSTTTHQMSKEQVANKACN